MFAKQNFILLGTIIKPHGRDGSIVLRNAEGIKEKIHIGNPVCIDINGLVPFFVLSFHPLDDNTISLRLKNIESIEQAEKLRNYDIYLPVGKESSPAVEQTIDKQSFIGYTAIDQAKGVIGIINAYIANSMNPLFEVNNGEILIPAVPEFIFSVDKKNKQITFSLPEGLL